MSVRSILLRRSWVQDPQLSLVVSGSAPSTVTSRPRLTDNTVKFEVQKVEEKGLDLTSGHRIHVESWSISHEDAAKSDSAKLVR